MQWSISVEVRVKIFSYSIDELNVERSFDEQKKKMEISCRIILNKYDIDIQWSP